MDQELDIQQLRKSLAALTRQLQQAQAKVVATIEAKHSEFVAASEQVTGLRGAVAQLKSDLQHAARLLGRQPSDSRTQVEAVEDSPVPRLRAAVAEHARLKEETQALEAGAAVLTTLMQVQRQLSELDALTAALRYEDAAVASLEISKALRTISSRDPSHEPMMVRAAKLEYYQRRAVLTKQLDDALSQLLTFSSRAITARQTVRCSDTSAAKASTTLRQVWDALQVLGLRTQRAEKLAELAHRKLLSPLLEAGRRLPPSRELAAGASASKPPEATIWAWFEADIAGSAAPSAQRTSLPPVQSVLPAIHSLFQFLHEHWTAGVEEVFSILGKRLWPSVARALVQHFDACSRDGGEALESFEATMLESGVARGNDRTLSRHVQQHRLAQADHRRASILAEMREAILRGQSAALVLVSDAEEPGSMTQLLEGTDWDDDEHLRSPAPEVCGRAISGELKQALREDTSLLRLPQMKVSASVHRLAERLRELMSEVSAMARQGRAEAAQDLHQLIREICTLFAVLRPYAQKGHLKTSPRSCAIFLTDCLYLVYVLLLLPYTYAQQLPTDQQHLALFIDLAPELRRLGESHFFGMLHNLKDQIASVLEPCIFVPGISGNRMFIAAEAALGSAVQQVKLAAQGFSETLPTQLLREFTGILLGVVCRNLLDKLFGLYYIESEEVDSVTALLGSVLSAGPQALAAAGLGEGAGDGSGRARWRTDADDAGRLDEDVPGWRALAVTVDLLGSDFSRFLERRTEVVQALRKDEALKLMELSWRDEAISPEEAWAVLAAEN